MYILICSDGSFYTGSTTDLNRRLEQHSSGNGANHTKKRLPISLVYSEEFDRIDHAFRREKQIQRWTHAKKLALVKGNHQKLKELAQCMNMSHFLLRKVVREE
jgi:putative endonuclease